MRRLLFIFGLLLCAVGAPAQTTTFNGVIKDLTGTPVPTGQVTFQLKPGIDTTISGSSRFVPATTFCEIHNPGVVSTSGTGTITVVVDTAQNWLAGDSLIFVGTPDATLNASSVASPYVITTRNSSTSFVFTQSGAHTNGAGGTVGGLYKSGGTGACAVMQNTAITPANTSYTVAIQAIFSPSSAFNTYAIGSGPVDISTVVPTPSQMPAYSFADTFSNQTVGGNKSFTGNNVSTGVNTACQLNSVLYVGGLITCWAGADIGAQINTAYAALPSTGGKIYILPQTGGGCYNFSTPIVLQTSGKYAPIEGIYTGDQTGAVSQGVCLNYTPTTATIAMTLDYSPAAGGDYTGFTALANIMLKNNGCATVGGCASSATGVKTGVVNGGIHFGTFKNVILQGFGTGLNFAEASGVGWAFQAENTSIVFNTTGLTFGTLHEQMHWIGGTIAGNGTGINVPNATDANFAFVSLDINTLAINNAGGNISFTGCHWENSGGSGTVQYLTQSTGNFVIHAGEMLNDTNSGTVAQMITTTGGFFQIEGLTIFSGGQTVTNLINNTGGGVGDATYFTGSPSLIAPAVYATCATPYNCHVKRLTGATPQLIAPILTIPFAGGGLPAGTAAAGMVGYNAGTNRTQLNDNNTGFSNVVTAASTDTLANKTLTAPALTNATGSLASPTLTTPVISTGVSQGSGFKHQRFGGVLAGTCPTAAAIGAACTSGNLNWTTGFADNSYTVTCSLVGSMTGQPHIVNLAYQAAGAGITLTIAADTAAAANVAAAGFVDCSATHD